MNSKIQRNFQILLFYFYPKVKYYNLNYIMLYF